MNNEKLHIINTTPTKTMTFAPGVPLLPEH